VSYNASAVKIYNATSSLERFENKKYFLLFMKRSSLLQRWRCIAVNFYSATGSLVRFENKNIFFYLQNAPAYYNAGVV
jgi:hypothetical protein